jgi:hypothetical protein
MGETKGRGKGLKREKKVKIKRESFCQEVPIREGGGLMNPRMKVLALCIGLLRVCLSNIRQGLQLSPQKQKLVNDQHLDRLFCLLSPPPVKEE